MIDFKEDHLLKFLKVDEANKKSISESAKLDEIIIYYCPINFLINFMTCCLIREQNVSFHAKYSHYLLQ
jgi:hypothetical protein